jgi:hypothetical protein
MFIVPVMSTPFLRCLVMIMDVFAINFFKRFLLSIYASKKKYIIPNFLYKRLVNGLADRGPHTLAIGEVTLIQDILVNLQHYTKNR